MGRYKAPINSWMERVGTVITEAIANKVMALLLWPFIATIGGDAHANGEWRAEWMGHIGTR